MIIVKFNKILSVVTAEKRMLIIFLLHTTEEYLQEVVLRF